MAFLADGACGIAVLCAFMAGKVDAVAVAVLAAFCFPCMTRTLLPPEATISSQL